MTTANIYIVREMPRFCGVFPQVFTSRSAAKRQFDMQKTRMSTKAETLELIQHSIVGTPKSIAAKAMEVASVEVGSYLAKAKDSLQEPLHESFALHCEINPAHVEATT